MLDLKKLHEKERGLLQRKAKLESDLARLQKKQKEAARRDDTRRKIVLGGCVLAAVEAGDVPDHFVASIVRNHVAQRDEKLFVGTPFAVVREGAEAAPPEAVAAETRE